MPDNNTVVPHGVAYEEFKAATEHAPPEMQISKGAIAVMFESSRPFTITEYAWKSDKLHEHEPKMWDDLIGDDSLHRFGNFTDCHNRQFLQTCR